MASRGIGFLDAVAPVAVDDLRLDRRHPLRAFPAVHVRRVVIRFVLDDPFADLEREIEAGEIRVSRFENIHDAQTLPVVFEAALAGHEFVQDILARVAERGMAEIVRERDRFGKLFIHRECARDGP